MQESLHAALQRGVSGGVQPCAGERPRLRTARQQRDDASSITSGARTIRVRAAPGVTQTFVHVEAF